MSNLFGQSGGRTAATTQPKAMGIDLQGAQYGPPVPVVYGQNRVPGNVIWYGDFQSVQHTQSVGKGFGGGTSTSYTYSASYLNGLCEGPIIGIAQVWSGNSIVLLSTLAPFSATGTASQAPWSHLPAPANLSYAYTALFGVQNMALGGSPTLPNYNYEVQALEQYGSGIVDANPAAILTDICGSTTHGVPFPFLGSLTQYSAYCVANSLFLSPVYDQQSTAVQVLSDLFKATNTYPYFSEGLLKVVPLGDVAVTGNSVTYTPNVTPLVNLGPDDFIVSGHASPVEVSRKAPQDAYNAVSIQFEDRANTYHNSAIVATIDEDMIANGARMTQTANINGCVLAATARFIAQNMVQRAYFVRNQYKFKLAWRYCYLEPTDIVTLTDINTGLSSFPVRILSVGEDAHGLLDITAEEFPEGIGHSAVYGTQPNSGTNVDPLTDPGPVNAPFLFRMPGYLVGGANPEIGCAVCGSGALWGGADIHISYDGTSYQYLGSLNAPARYGTTTSSLPTPIPADPDTTTILGVQLYAPGVLLGGTQADADNLSTLCLVGTELLAYETAALTGANAYNLSYLRRQAYGTSNPSTLAGGASFVRLDDAIYRIPVDPSLIGSTIYLKFLSVNSLGRTPRTLASETAYSYVVGSSVELPDVPPMPAGFAVLAIADGIQLSWTNTVPAAVSQVAIYRSTASAGPFTLTASVGPTATTWVDHFTNGATWYYYITARGPLISSGWSADTATISSTGKTVANGATVGAQLGTNLVQSNGSTVVSNLDQFPDGTTYLRGIQSSHRESVDNADFEASTSAAPVPGWTASNATLSYVTGAGVYSGTQSLLVTNTAQYGAASSNRKYPCTPGDVYLIGGAIENVSAAGPAYVQLTFYNAAGASTGNGGVSSTAATWSYQAAQVTVPAASVYFEIALQNDSATAGASAAYDSIRLARVRSLDTEVQDGTTYARILGTQLTSGQHNLEIAGSGHQVGDQLNLYPILTAGAQAVWENLSITYTSAAGTPATATISVTAAQVLGLKNAGALVSYNASSIGVTGTNGTSPTYFLYYIDPTGVGGTKTLYATTTSNTMRQQLGIVYIGSVVVAFPTSGSGGGSGGGGLCVADGMWVHEGLRAGDAVEGDTFECVDWPTGCGKHVRGLIGVTRGEEQCVRIVTYAGAALVCSISTPFDLPDGRTLLAPDMLGADVLTDLGIERIASVSDAGRQQVSRIHLGGASYAAGEDATHRIYSHNGTSKP